jgi:hypothetical protein
MGQPSGPAVADPGSKPIRQWRMPSAVYFDLISYQPQKQVIFLTAGLVLRAFLKEIYRGSSALIVCWIFLCLCHVLRLPAHSPLRSPVLCKMMGR